MTFDLVGSTIATTTLAKAHCGVRVNVERSKPAGEEVGGHESPA